WHYPDATSIEPRIAEVRRDVAGLVDIAREHGVVTGFHNHSGNYVGAALWDIRAIIGDMDGRSLFRPLSRDHRGRGGRMANRAPHGARAHQDGGYQRFLLGKTRREMESAHVSVGRRHGRLAEIFLSPRRRALHATG